MSEGSLWTYVRDKILVPSVHATRIENGISAGFPDVHLTYRGRSATIELKFLRKKNFPLGKDGLNRDQKLWIEAELEAEGNVWILVEGNSEIFLVNGTHYDRVNEWSREDYLKWGAWMFRKGTRMKPEQGYKFMSLVFLS